MNWGALVFRLVHAEVPILRPEYGCFPCEYFDMQHLKGLRNYQTTGHHNTENP
jgi:hypothetical protein